MRTVTLLVAMLLPVAASASKPRRAATVEKRPVDYRPRVDIDFKDGDLRRVLRLLSAAGFFKIVMAPNVNGTVTICLQDTPWDEVLEVIAQDAKLVYERQGKTIYVRNAK